MVQHFLFYGIIFSKNKILFINDKTINRYSSTDESISEILIISGMVIGIGIGVITDNFMWGTAAAFIGMGVGEILDYIKKHKK